MTLAQLHKDIVQKLNLNYSINEAKAISYSLLQHYGGYSRVQMLAFPETEITEKVEQQILFAIQQLQTHKPLQYVIGETTFCNLQIAVSEAVLIPRPETEELVNWVTQEINSETNPTIIDLCTGSGCIAIALKKILPQATMWACDISPEALEVAKKNALANEVKINFFECDILSEKLNSEMLFSTIVSNPPYVRNSEKLQMAENVLNYEPHLALFVEDDNPLIFYRTIAQFAKKHLQIGGALYVEINEAFGDAVKELFVNEGFAEVVIRQDIHGKNRMIKAKK